EAAAALDDLGHAVDGHHALDVLALLLATVVAAAPTLAASATAVLATLRGRAGRAGASVSLLCSHVSLLQLSTRGLQVQARVASAVGDGGHAAVVRVTGAVEDDRRDALGPGALGDQTADLTCLVGLLGVGLAKLGLEGRRRGERDALRVVHELRHHVA